MRTQLACAVALLALVTSITGLVASAASFGPYAAQAPVRPTLQIVAGLGDGVISANDFVGDPNLGLKTVRVLEGTRVAWILGSDESHTVTFLAGQPAPAIFMLQPESPSRPAMLNPRLMTPTIPEGPWDGASFVHAELNQRGQEVAITFARPGRYDYLCLFHPAMTGTVEVVLPGSPGITSQAAIDTAAALHYGQEHASQVEEIFATRKAPTRVDGPRGTSVAMVRAGTDVRWGHVDVQAFLPENVTIQQGDTVIWYGDHVQPHTVTFQPATGTRPDFLQVQLPDGRLISAPPPDAPPSAELLQLMADPEVAPRLVLGPAALQSNDPVYDGRGLYSSGLIGEHPLIDVPMQKAWGLTFNTPGTFEYSCAIHESIGMKGSVTVLPR